MDQKETNINSENYQNQTQSINQTINNGEQSQSKDDFNARNDTSEVSQHSIVIQPINTAPITPDPIAPPANRNNIVQPTIIPPISSNSEPLLQATKKKKYIVPISILAIVFAATVAILCIPEFKKTIFGFFSLNDAKSVSTINTSSNTKGDNLADTESLKSRYNLSSYATPYDKTIADKSVCTRNLNPKSGITVKKEVTLYYTVDALEHIILFDTWTHSNETDVIKTHGSIIEYANKNKDKERAAEAQYGIDYEHNMKIDGNVYTEVYKYGPQGLKYANINGINLGKPYSQIRNYFVDNGYSCSDI